MEKKMRLLPHFILKNINSKCICLTYEKNFKTIRKKKKNNISEEWTKDTLI